MALAEIAQSGSDVTAPMMLASRGMKIILGGLLSGSGLTVA